MAAARASDRNDGAEVSNQAGQFDRDSVLEFFNAHPERPWHEQDVARKLGVTERSELRSLLGELTEEGRLIRTRRRTYGLPQEMNLLVGRLQVTSGGNGFVILDEGGDDLFVPADELGGGWDGDKVVARPDAGPSEGNRQSAEIVRVLERKHKRVVGTLEFSQGYAILRPDSSRLAKRILLTPDSVGDYQAGSRLVATLVWPEDSGESEPFGTVTDYLGEGDDADIETRAVIIKFDLKDEFDPETEKEAAAVPQEVSEADRKGRLDLRDKTTFTIDGADARDFDDAISLERLRGKNQSGQLRVGIHIADVSHYVTEGSALDNEARDRATSVYLPNRVLPMLPEALSNGICSLVEGQDRLAMSALLDLDRQGKVHNVSFKATVIKSDARLTYDEVQAFADGDRLPMGRRKLEKDIKVLLDLTQVLRRQRFENGALDFDLPEARVEVGEDGELEVRPVRSNQARQLIEELMLLANRHVAAEMDKRNIPALYRVHEDPNEDRLEALVRGVARLGYNLNQDDIKPADLQRLLGEVAGKPEAQLVNMLVLRSLKQARYSPENLGHFGLGFENYLHFTSPIRRYPDLVVHRSMRASLLSRPKKGEKARLESELPALAEHTSEKERAAEDAERDLTRYFHAKWAKEHVGEAFTGSVVGVTNFGMFVALPNGVEGLLHVSNLDDDYYMYFEDSLMLMGKHTRKKFRFGDRVEIKILNSSPASRQIDLIPAAQEMPETDRDDVAKADTTAQKKPKKGKEPRHQPSQPPAARKGQAAADRQEEQKAEPKPEDRPEQERRSKPKRKDRRRRDDEVSGVSPADQAPSGTGQTAKPARRRRRLVFGRKY